MPSSAANCEPLLTRRRLFPFLFAPYFASGRKFYTYVGRITPDSVLLAWGTCEGANTIGRSSAPHGKAEVRIGGRTLAESQRNWLVVPGLAPDSSYPYEIFLNENKIGAGVVRTCPVKTDKLAFFVIGDYGTGRRPQYEIASAMARVLRERERTANPVRFVLTTGDNIYSDRVLGLPAGNSGDRDSHWARKFFEPYQDLLRSVPFYPTLGNHDGDESESPGDLDAWLDNFIFPADPPARYYRFGFGGLADFFALDTTAIGAHGGKPIYAEGGEQHEWLRKALSNSRAPWKIAYFHHPPFNAGPGHPPSLDKLRHLVALLGEGGVQMAFNGHEHNFQWSAKNAETAGVRYVISGSGGDLRGADVRKNLAAANIEAWAPEHQFLLVEISGGDLEVRVLGTHPVVLRDKDGREVPQPLRATLAREPG